MRFGLSLTPLLLTLLLSGCHRNPAPLAQALADAAPPAPDSGANLAAPLAEVADGSPADASPRGIAWQLTASPSTTFPMSKRGEFELSVVARNDGPGIVDTRDNSLGFDVNSRVSLMLELAFGNGGRERRWKALPPGQTVRQGRGSSSDPTFGQSLFPAPGDYHLTLRQDGRQLAALDVHVLPD